MFLSLFLANLFQLWIMKQRKLDNGVSENCNKFIYNNYSKGMDFNVLINF